MSWINPFTIFFTLWIVLFIIGIFLAKRRAKKTKKFLEQEGFDIPETKYLTTSTKSYFLRGKKYIDYMQTELISYTYHRGSYSRRGYSSSSSITYYGFAFSYSGAYLPKINISYKLWNLFGLHTVPLPEELSHKFVAYAEDETSVHSFIEGIVPILRDFSTLYSVESDGQRIFLLFREPLDSVEAKAEQLATLLRPIFNSSTVTYTESVKKTYNEQRVPQFHIDKKVTKIVLIIFLCIFGFNILLFFLVPLLLRLFISAAT